MIDEAEALELQNIVHAAQITDRWVAILGIGFHPDTCPKILAWFADHDIKI